MRWGAEVLRAGVGRRGCRQGKARGGGGKENDAARATERVAASPVPTKGGRDWSVDVDDMLAAFMGVPPVPQQQGAGRSTAARP